jgi:hypothetical protein
LTTEDYKGICKKYPHHFICHSCDRLVFSKTDIKERYEMCEKFKEIRESVDTWYDNNKEIMMKEINDNIIDGKYIGT